MVSDRSSGERMPSSPTRSYFVKGVSDDEELNEMLTRSDGAYLVKGVRDDEELNEMLIRSDDASITETTGMEKSDEVKTAKVPRYPLFSTKSTRLRICMMLTTGLFVTVSMRLDLSMAIVCMVNSTAFTSHHSTSDSLPNTTTASPRCYSLNYDQQSAVQAGYTGDFLWSPPMQSVLLSATFYGGLATISFAGVLADKYGPKTILIIVTLDYIIVTLLTPLLSRWSYYAYFVSRLFMGLGEGFFFPCLSCLVGKWFAPAEKSTVAALYTSGNQIAASLSSLISAHLCSSSIGWPSIFYLFGALGCVWLVGFYLYVTNSPTTHKCISEDEKAYLAEQIQHTHAKSIGPVPWRAMLTSIPLIAAVLCQYTYNLQASLLQAFLPSFIKEELMLPLNSNGYYSMIPFISQLISKNILGVIADYLKRNNIFGHTKCAKIFQSIGSFGSATMLIALATLPDCEHPYIALPLLALYGAFFSAGICGFFTCILCIAPPFSGTTTSISMVFGMLGNISGPLMLGVVSKMGFVNKWMTSFMLCSAANVLAGIIFIIFGSAKVQHWAKIQPSKNSA